MKPKSKRSQNRQPHQKKMMIAREKSLRGKAETSYGELKQRCCYSITPTCHANLQDVGRQLGCSASEVLERFSRVAHQLLVFLQPLEKTESQSPEELSSYVKGETLDCPNLELFEIPE